jgi:DNA polymerase-4
MHYIGLIYVDKFFATHHPCEGPLVVTQHRLVLDANASARQRKIEPGMGLNEARLLGQDLKIVEYDADRYQAAAHRFWDQVANYSDYVEPIREDQVLLDLTAHPNPCSLAKQIIRQIPQARLALAPCRWMVQAALPDARPYRDVTVAESPFLANLSIRQFLGVPESTRNRLISLGYERVSDLAVLPAEAFIKQFGREGLAIYRAVRGQDDTVILPAWPRGSLSRSLSFEGAVTEEEPIREGLERLSREVGTELLNSDQSGKSIQLSFETEPGIWEKRERTFARPMQSPASVFALARLLLNPWPAQPIVTLRLRLPQLETASRAQSGLGVMANGERRLELEAVVSRVAGTFGQASVGLARNVEEPRRKRLLRVWKDATGWY